MPRDEDRKIWHDYAKGVKRPNAKLKKGSGFIDPPPNLPLKGGGIRAVKTASSHLPLHHLIIETERAVRTQNVSPPLRGRLGGFSPSKPEFEGKLLDKKIERQLRQGAVEIEARLDLHGMTQDRAYAALEKFLAAQVKAARRNLLVITGKGRAGRSVLRDNLMGWLETVSAASQILSVRTASLKHGGSGAFYVILRKAKGRI
jgi:DNA-nicking Smr family endonuclease